MESEEKYAREKYLLELKGERRRTQCNHAHTLELEQERVY